MPLFVHVTIALILLPYIEMIILTEVIQKSLLYAFKGLINNDNLIRSFFSIFG